MLSNNESAQLHVNTIRTLSMDIVEKAKSGHPGMPMGTADIAYVLWTKFLRHNPKNPKWLNRDRFILSGGHGSALLYSLLHLTGYNLSMDELQSFRQWGSKTPGHPEFGHTEGVEMTTGPLGQGFASSVGMAIAEKFLAKTFNKQDFTIFDNFIYALVTDGDLMEGISHEAASIAGHLKLDNLIYLYDSNGISIDGPTSLTFSDDTKKRFEAYGWFVLEIDGHNLEAIENAIKAAQEQQKQPSIIICKTHIGFGSPNKQDHCEAHGSPLGDGEVKLAKEKLGWPKDQTFYIPEEVLKHFRSAVQKGDKLEENWNDKLSAYFKKYPDEEEKWNNFFRNGYKKILDEKMVTFQPSEGAIATRAASGKILNFYSPYIQNLVGGSADLTPSNNTEQKKLSWFSAENREGRNLHFGVREHAMGAILNGMTLYGGLKPYGATFLIFFDYMKPAIRLAAIMKLPVTFIFTHDSFALGEDGPTHQPIEQLASLRAIPDITLFRPADANETAVGWKLALEAENKPFIMVLTRQNLPILDKSNLKIVGGPEKGAYILADTTFYPDLIIIATGSEVSTAMEVQKLLLQNRVFSRIVSMPSMEIFEAQHPDYKNSIIPEEVTKVFAIEAGSSFGWERYTKNRNHIFGINHFGASAPAKILAEKFDFSPSTIADKIMCFTRHST